MRITDGLDGRRLNRAEFLRLSGLTATAILLGTGEFQSGRAHAAPSFAANPFSLGVASGDPARTSVVLWTRLAPDPLARDGLGGMPPDPVTVRYEVAKDEAFRRLVRRGAVEATADLAHSVHAEVHGLRPGREYFYRFKAGADTSPIGRTRTTPNGRVGSLRFALASCQRWQEGFYTAHGEIAAEDLDLVAFVGDYIYENGFGATGGVRNVALPAEVRRECSTLTEYRWRYGIYKADADLQAAHAAHPWLVTWDDHEVDDNYASLTPGAAQPAGVAFRSAAPRPTVPSTSTCRYGAHRCRPAPTSACSAASRSAGSPTSSSWTAASTAACRRAAATSRPPAPSRSTRHARCSARRRRHGCWTASIGRPRAGTSSPSRCSCAAPIATPGPSYGPRWTTGTATRRRASGSSTASRRAV